MEIGFQTSKLVANIYKFVNNINNFRKKYLIPLILKTLKREFEVRLINLLLNLVLRLEFLNLMRNLKK